MWHVGIDLHRQFIVMAAVRDNGETMEPVKIACQETEAIVEVIRSLAPFRAVIEASGTYRWLYDLTRFWPRVNYLRTSAANRAAGRRRAARG